MPALMKPFHILYAIPCLLLPTIFVALLPQVRSTAERGPWKRLQDVVGQLKREAAPPADAPVGFGAPAPVRAGGGLETGGRRGSGRTPRAADDGSGRRGGRGAAHIRVTAHPEPLIIAARLLA